jgi:hypothetical protein
MKTNTLSKINFLLIICFILYSMTPEYAQEEHNHDGNYSDVAHHHEYAEKIHGHQVGYHSHAGDYAEDNHYHDYAKNRHDHNNLYNYAEDGHKHDRDYAEDDHDHYHDHDYADSGHDHVRTVKSGERYYRFGEKWLDSLIETAVYNQTLTAINNHKIQYH